MGQTHNKQLQYQIDTNDVNGVLETLTKYPQAINESLFSDSKLYPLQRACWRGDDRLCNLFLDLEADINQQSEKGLTALMFAIKRFHLNIALLLIQKKNCDLSIKDENGVNAMDYAILSGNYKLAYFLKNKYDQKFQEADYYFDLIKKGYSFSYCDYNVFIDYLKNNQDIINQEKLYERPKKKQLHDPVVDPRETWGQFIYRISEFENPPQVFKILCSVKEVNYQRIYNLRTDIQEQ